MWGDLYHVQVMAKCDDFEILSFCVDWMYYRCDYHKIIYSVRLLVWKLVRVVINFLSHPDILILFSDYGWMIMRLRLCKTLSYKSFDTNSTNQSMSNYKLMVTTGSWCVFYFSRFNVAQECTYYYVCIEFSLIAWELQISVRLGKQNWDIRSVSETP